MKITEFEEYTPEIDQISRSDAVEGGSSGVSMQPIKQLANRTKWLKAIADEVVAARAAFASLSARLASFVSGNTSITGATKTKITYDQKGLITAGADLQTSDIPSLDWSKIGSGKPTTLSGYGISDAATAAQGAKADAALPATSFNPSAFATAAQGAKADAALPATSFNPSAFATAAQGAKADAALPATSFNPSAFATAAQGTKADAALPASTYTADDILAKLLAVDADDAGLNASTLQGVARDGFYRAGSGHSGHIASGENVLTKILALGFEGTLSSELGAIDTPEGSSGATQYWHYQVFRAWPSTAIVFAESPSTSRIMYTNKYTSGNWGGWNIIPPHLDSTPDAVFPNGLIYYKTIDVSSDDTGAFSTFHGVQNGGSAILAVSMMLRLSGLQWHATTNYTYGSTVFEWNDSTLHVTGVVESSLFRVFVTYTK